jgi:hypothetical protein
MFTTAGNNGLQKTTSHKVVIPFYLYASVAFLAGTVLLLLSGFSFSQHFFNPRSLALTHLLALGWGMMIIFGASHQLVPVLTNAKLFSDRLAMACFWCAGAGIPLLTAGFYLFSTGPLLLTGGILVNIGVLLFLVNVFMTIRSSGKEDVHALFLLTAAGWLFLTALFGLLIAINFTHPFLPGDFLRYLPLHAHMGIVGWFLLLVIGVGSRLIPLFLISKYNAPGLLWIVFILVNAGLAGFIADHLFFGPTPRMLIYVSCVTAGILLFAVYCVKAFRQRIRRQVDGQLKISLAAVVLMFLPVICLSFVLIFYKNETDSRLVHFYGFSIFMGWITALILGMTFKTFPFIVWNKIYQAKAASAKTPSPKELFSGSLFRLMLLCYLPGFILAGAGILSGQHFLTGTGSVFLVLAAVFYNWNVFNVLFHQPKIT